jgi:putative hemolysin
MVGDAVLVLVFILLGGVFAGAEIALVNLRPAQAAAMPERGRAGRAVARLLADQNRFLSAVQIGVTLAGFLSSAFGATRFAQLVAPTLEEWGVPTGLSEALAIVAVTLVIAYLSLVFGELVPKRLALRDSERFALLTGPILQAVAIAGRPLIWLLGRSTNAVMWLVGVRRQPEDTGSEEELRHAVATTEALTPDERRVLTDVLESGDRPMREIMTPRLDVDVLSADLTIAGAVDSVHDRPHSRYPVVRASLDDTVGFIHVRDLMGREGDDRTRLAELARPLLEVPESRPLLPTLAELRRTGVHIALVVDEYGGGAGIVTMEDLIEELVGDITDEFDPADEQIHARWDAEGVGAPPRTGDLPTEPVAAQLRLTEFAEMTGVELPDGPYDTAAGWILFQLGRIPGVGDAARHGDVVVTVAAMRGHRIEEVTLSRASAEPPVGDSPTGSADGGVRWPADDAPAPLVGSARGDGGEPGTEGAGEPVTGPAPRSRH